MADVLSLSRLHWANRVDAHGESERGPNGLVVSVYSMQKTGPEAMNSFLFKEQCLWLSELSVISSCFGS